MKGYDPMRAWPKCTVCQKPIFDHQYYIPDGMYHDTCTPLRNAKLFPKIGDTFSWNGELWRIDSITLRGWSMISGARGYAGHLDIACEWSTLDDFREWAKKAEVVYAAK